MRERRISASKFRKRNANLCRPSKYILKFNQKSSQFYYFCFYAINTFLESSANSLKKVGVKTESVPIYFQRISSACGYFIGFGKLEFFTFEALTLASNDMSRTRSSMAISSSRTRLNGVFFITCSCELLRLPLRLSKGVDVDEGLFYSQDI